MRAYSLGGGTYTGIEAVSNGLQILREPRVETARRTMRYMALSLAAVSSGILVSYMLEGVKEIRPHPQRGPHRERLGGVARGDIFRARDAVSKALLFVAAQAGFLDGPACLQTWRSTRGCRVASIS
jgi:hypothetical protein